MKSKIYDIVRIGVAVALLTSGVAYATGTWSEPTAAFPSGNVDAPINVGATNQVKSGSIGAAAFSTLNTSIDKAGDGAGIFRKISIQNTSGTEVAKIGTAGLIVGTGLQITTNPGNGKVLTSSTDGTATWQRPKVNISQRYIFGADASSIGSNGTYPLGIHDFCSLSAANYYSYNYQLRSSCYIYTYPDKSSNWYAAVKITDLGSSCEATCFDFPN